MSNLGLYYKTFQFCCRYRCFKFVCVTVIHYYLSQKFVAWGQYYKTFTSVIYIFCSKLERLSLASFSSLV
jgi:hypothetical protein